MRTSFICLIFAALFSLQVTASPLDDARQAGYVIETPDGFIKAQPGAPDRIDQLVKDINERRHQAYKKIAEEHGISVEQVGAESYRKRMAAEHQH